MKWKALAPVVLALLIALAGSAGRAEAAGGTYRITAGGDLNWFPESGAIDQTADDKLEATGTMVSTELRSGSDGTADYHIASGPGIVRARLSGSVTVPLGLFYPFDPSLQAVSTTELTVSGPDGFVNTSLNLHVDGVIETPVCGRPPCGAESVTVSVGPFVRQSEFTTLGETRDNSLGLAFDPVPGGYHVHGDVTSAQLGVRTNTPYPVTIVLNLSGRYAGSPTPTTLGGDFDDPGARYQVSFAPTGPVLNDIPAGYTVSGPSVVDNRWTDPFAPPSGDVVVTSCATLGQLTVVHGNLVIRNLQGCPAIALPNLTQVDGDIIIEGNDVGGAIDVSGTGGDLTITGNDVGGAINAGGTGGDLTITGNDVGGAINAGGAGGDLTIEDNGDAVVNVGGGVGGDLTVETGGTRSRRRLPAARPASRFWKAPRRCTP